MLFTSDNWAGVHPDILASMVAVNAMGPVPAYGGDDVTQTLQGLFSELFGGPVALGFAATGSAANSLALACLTPPWGVIFCHANGHIHLDEAAAPEFFTGGAKIIPLPGEHGKLTPRAIDEAMRFYLPSQTHHAVPAVVSLTQGTEAGTIYTVSEVSAVADTAKKYGLTVHMDGARFANTLAATGATAARMTRAAGVDVLTLGGTKNGCMLAEAIVFFDPQKAVTLPHRIKRAGQGFSKARFLSAQWQAYFRDDLWIRLARHANGMAARLAKGFVAHPDCRLVLPQQINEVFVTMPERLASALRDRGARFYDWVQPTDAHNGTLRRFVTSYETSTDDVDTFLRILTDC